MTTSTHKQLTVLERLLIPVIQTGVSCARAYESYVAAPEHRPAFSKSYPCRPTLSNRFYIPSCTASEPHKKFPLVIHIHGGGWIVNSPAHDDIYCASLARNSSVVVANINYRKAPLYKFPVGLDDCIEIAKAVLADSELPIDTSNVVLSGMSAGGNLCLVLAQMEEFKSALKGVIAWYPWVDFETALEEKMSHRVEAEAGDKLYNVYGVIESAYLALDDDRASVRLSVTNFKGRESFPKHVYIIGAEEDVLCWEAKVMAKKLAAGEVKKSTPNGWVTDSGITWELAEGQMHGFDKVKQSSDREVQRKVVLNRIENNASAWLEEVLQS